MKSSADQPPAARHIPQPPPALRPDAPAPLRLITAVLIVLAAPLQTTLPAADDLYQQQIQPLLAQKCAACHGTLKQAAGLRLDFGKGLLKGGESGPAIVPGNPEQSLVLQRVAAAEDSERMPPAGEGEHLTPPQIELLRTWIAAGAAFPENEQPPADPASWWSYQPVTSPTPPDVNNNPWARNAIDRFILQQQLKHGLSPAPEAPPEVLLRRLYIDLLGIPPTRSELTQYLSDPDPARFEKIVDQLLERPEYGQRWGRHWMDVWRYSDWYGSRGINEIRYSQRHIWRWRDWIVESLNHDKPYNQMLVEMLAGDELDPANPDVLRATGFLGRNWYKFDRNVWMFDTVEHTSQAFLGLTLRCARCHDHKFDPITHEDYYRFRAFFEAHDVRTDPVSGNLETEKDATLGPVLREGLARVFDRDPAAPTYLFQRGDNRYPDTSRIIPPGVPAVLRGKLHIEPVSLPAEAWYPQLRPAVADGLIHTAEQLVQQKQQALTAARAAADAAQAAADQAHTEASTKPDTPPAPALHDTFPSQSPRWTVLSGNWEWQDGLLRQTAVTSFATLVADTTLPRNFEATVRWRTLQPGSLRSVGFSFDYINTGDSQDIYTSTGDAAQSVQAFHRLNGQQHYPAAGIVKTQLAVGAETRIDLTVRDQQLILKLNGQQQLDYTMPAPRRDGRFALWVHQGAAEFLEVSIRPLVPTPESLRNTARQAHATVRSAAASAAQASAELESLRARITAEIARTKQLPEPELHPLAVAAAAAEKQAAIAAAHTELAAAQALLEELLLANPPADNTAGSSNPNPNPSSAETEARKKVDDILLRISTLETQRNSGSTEYSPLGTTWPASSSGRRLALARWIASPENPRTARIAVNHIWLRHFGEALVPTVANFGLNGNSPSHPELLDYLASQLGSHDWKMKSVHRLILTSATWRQSSASDHAEHNIQIDPGNRWLWRMNSRRLEAEAVRDSLLAVTGTLDLSHGGPEIPEQQMQQLPRRSLYFRNTPNEKSSLLEPFDLANPNECYRRQASVIPQQALALMNSSLALDSARLLAEKLSPNPDHSSHDFIRSAFETILSRAPTPPEIQACLDFLNQPGPTTPDTTLYPAGTNTAQRPPSANPHQRSRENLLLVLFSHNDFITLR